MFGRLWKIITVQQDSLPGLFNWKDAVHVIRVSALAALALAGITFLQGVDKFDFGLADKLIADAIFAAITAIEAWKVNNS